jgi:hypothetical protein
MAAQSQKTSLTPARPMRRTRIATHAKSKPAEVEAYDPMTQGQWVPLPLDMRKVLLNKLTPAQYALVWYLAGELWYTMTAAGKRRAPEAWTRAIGNRTLAKECGMSEVAVREMTENAVEAGIIAMQAEPGGRGYRYALLVKNWPNVLTVDERIAIKKAAAAAAEEAEPEAEDESLLTRNQSQVVEKLIVLPGKHGKTMRLSDAIKVQPFNAGSHATEFYCSIAESGTIRVELRDPVALDSPPDSRSEQKANHESRLSSRGRVGELIDCLDSFWIQRFGKSLAVDLKFASEIAAQLKTAPIAGFVQFASARLAQPKAKTGLVLSLACEYAAVHKRREHAAERNRLANQQAADASTDKDREMYRRVLADPAADAASKQLARELLGDTVA